MQVTIRGVGTRIGTLDDITLAGMAKTSRLNVYWQGGYRADEVRFILGLDWNVDMPSKLERVHFCIHTLDCRMTRPNPDDLVQSFPSSLKHLSLRASHDNPLAVPVLCKLIGDMDKTLSTLTVYGLNVDRLREVQQVFIDRSIRKSITTQYLGEGGTTTKMVLTFV